MRETPERKRRRMKWVVIVLTLIFLCVFLLTLKLCIDEGRDLAAKKAQEEAAEIKALYENVPMVMTAKSQIGYKAGKRYWSWYGYDKRVSWCGCFISWCGAKNGYIRKDIIPVFSYVPSGAAWFKQRGLWRKGGKKPKSGDIIFFDWDKNDIPNHVGIVKYARDGKVHTIEGNAHNRVRELTYSQDDEAIFGYGTPLYPK